MSYDYTVMRLARQVTRASDLEPANLLGLGQAEEVRRKLDSVVAGIEWMDRFGSVRTEHGWIEFGVEERWSQDLSFRVRTSHRSDRDWEESILRQVAIAFGWAVVDHQTLMLFDGQHDLQLQ